jgi:hypothetical protein
VNQPAALGNKFTSSDSSTTCESLIRVSVDFFSCFCSKSFTEFHSRLPLAITRHSPFNEFIGVEKLFGIELFHAARFSVTVFSASISVLISFMALTQSRDVSRLQLTYSSEFSVSHEASLLEVLNFIMKKFELEVEILMFRLRQDCFVINFPVDFVNLWFKWILV